MKLLKTISHGMVSTTEQEVIYDQPLLNHLRCTTALHACIAMSLWKTEPELMTFNLAAYMRSWSLLFVVTTTTLFVDI